MFTLAHLSDPHLAPLPQPRPAELVGKRGLGFLNWQRGRKNVHRPEVLDAVVRDLHASGADHIAATGDLVNLALPEEYVRARLWLETLGSPANITVVPGNHDIYVSAAQSWPAAYWGDYMCGDDGRNGGSFPFLRRRGPVALIALSTALPTAPFLATGTLGDAQLSSVAAMLDQTGGQFRVVLIHHPPLSSSGRYLKRLTDAARLRRMLAAKGAELLLHGHDHRSSLVWLDGPGKPIPAVGVPSASSRADDKEHAAGYNVFRIEGAPGAWRCAMTARRRTADNAIADAERCMLFKIASPRTRRLRPA